MTTVTALRENCDDILADAREINEQRAMEEAAQEICDTAEDTAAQPVEALQDEA